MEELIQKYRQMVEKLNKSLNNVESLAGYADIEARIETYEEVIQDLLNTTIK